MLQELEMAIQQLRNPERAAFMAKYFKTGKGEYAEGDIFLGLSNPQVRVLVKRFSKKIAPQAITQLLTNPIHEYRFCGLMIWVEQFKKADIATQAQIIELYLAHIDYINNWDLVDCSAYYLVGVWLLDKDRSILYDLAQSKHLWAQRVAIISTLAFIRKGQFADTLQLAELFLPHTHDLIHKASGWMLREIGKRDILTLTEFLDEHSPKMPRTMLRYAIEKLPEKDRQYYLKRK